MSDIDDLQAIMIREFGKLHGKVDGLKGAVDHIADAQLEEYQRADRHARRLDSLETSQRIVTRASTMASVPDFDVNPADITGTFELEEIRRAHRTRKSDAKHLRRKKLDWTIGALVAIVISVAAALITSQFRK